MSIRLPLLLAASLATCSEPHSSIRGELPQAPPPRPKAEKTKAELLVGTWRLFSREGNAVPKTFELRLDFSRDGKVTIHVEKSRSGPEPPRPGTYRLDGDTIWLHTEATTEAMAQDWSVRIKLLTESKLVIVAPEGRQGSGFVRLRK